MDKGMEIRTSEGTGKVVLSSNDEKIGIIYPDEVITLAEYMSSLLESELPKIPSAAVRWWRQAFVTLKLPPWSFWPEEIRDFTQDRTMKKLMSPQFVLKKCYFFWEMCPGKRHWDKKRILKIVMAMAAMESWVEYQANWKKKS